MSRQRNRIVVAGVIVGVIGVVIAAGVLFAVRATVVPNVIERSAEDASAAFSDAGLRMSEPGRIATTAVGDGLVFSQRPLSGIRVPRRSSADVTVAVTPVVDLVPEVVGLQSDAAIERLDDALYLNRQLDVFDADDPAGEVIEQLPTAGSKWRTGLPVAITVAVGPDDGTGVAVPDMKGANLEVALADLGEAGLAGTAFVANITTLQSNKVVSQIPVGGVLVRPGSTVLLLLEPP